MYVFIRVLPTPRDNSGTMDVITLVSVKMALLEYTDVTIG